MLQIVKIIQMIQMNDIVFVCTLPKDDLNANNNKRIQMNKWIQIIKKQTF